MQRRTFSQEVERLGGWGKFTLVWTVVIVGCLLIGIAAMGNAERREKAKAHQSAVEQSGAQADPNFEWFDTVKAQNAAGRVSDSQLLAVGWNLARKYSDGGVDLQEATIRLRELESKFHDRILSDPADKDALQAIQIALAARSQQLQFINGPCSAKPSGGQVASSVAATIDC